MNIGDFGYKVTHNLKIVFDLRVVHSQNRLPFVGRSGELGRAERVNDLATEGEGCLEIEVGTAQRHSLCKSRSHAQT
jgi:hypothetical protein